MHSINIVSKDISSTTKDNLQNAIVPFLNKILVSFDFKPETNIVFSNITESDFKYEVINKKNQLLANKISIAIQDNSKEIKSIFNKYI